MTCTPDVLWAQREDSVYVTIDLKEVIDMQVTLEEDRLKFSGKVGVNTYACEIEFPAKIIKAESKCKTTRLVEIFLKKEEAKTWTHLRKQGKASWIKIDWPKWQDSDDEDEKKGNFNLDGMGDMNFGDMGGQGDDDFDSDDEEEQLPDFSQADDTGRIPDVLPEAKTKAAASGGYSAAPSPPAPAPIDKDLD
jgi:prostaglandin-E synthase